MPRSRAANRAWSPSPWSVHATRRGWAGGPPRSPSTRGACAPCAFPAIRGARSTAPTTRYEANQGGLALVIEETVTDTANPVIRKIDLAVADARDPARVLTRLTGYVSR